MREYVTTTDCLMEFLRRELDDSGATRCGRCANCVGPRFSTEVSEPLTEKAIAFLRRNPLDIEPRKVVPTELRGHVDLREHPIEPGRSLTRWGDPGLAQLVKDGKYRDGRFDDSLVEATIAMIGQWTPTPYPTWLTWVPSSSSVVEDFARRLADALGLEAVSALRRVRPSPPQKTMENSSQQASNVFGVFEVLEIRPGPVFLFDDMVDSRWTLNVVGSQLRAAGSGPVYPVALADTSRGGE
jgi:ATP-dependent DNA helicase RecQ